MKQATHSLLPEHDVFPDTSRQATLLAAVAAIGLLVVAAMVRPYGWITLALVALAAGALNFARRQRELEKRNQPEPDDRESCE